MPDESYAVVDNSGIRLTDIMTVNFEGRSFVEEKRTLRALSYQMLPQFVFDQYPTFVEFAETFLDFIEKKYTPDGMPQPGPYHILKNLLETADIDQTELEFVQLLKIKLGRDLPASTAYDLRTFLKHIKDFYLSKGTENSIQFFFRSVFNTFSRIYLPKVDLVRASYSTWYVPYVTQLQSLGGPLLDAEGLTALFDASLYGQTSKQTAWLGGVKAGPVIEILAHSGEFTAGETVTVTKTDGTTIDLWIPLGGIEFQEGSFLTDDGMPSSTKRLQDSYYWQEFSYDVISPNEISDIVNPLVMNVHPAGFKIFARVTDENPVVVDPEFAGEDGEIEIIYRHFTLHISQTMEDDAEDPIVLIQFPLNFDFMSFVQSYVDVGEFFQEEETLAFSLVYPNIVSFDLQQLATLEKDEPQFAVYADFVGLKLPMGNEPVPGYVDDEARVYSYADQVASIGFGGFSIETMEDVTIEEASRAYCRGFGRREVRSEVLTISAADLAFFQAGSITSTALYGKIPIESGWSNSNTSGNLALVFLNGRLVKSPQAVMTTEIVEGERVAKLTVNGKDADGVIMDSTPLYEILYLSDKDIGATTHSTSTTLTTGQETFEWASLPDEADFIMVYRNGYFLTPFADYSIETPGTNKIRFQNPSESIAGQRLDVTILARRSHTGTTFAPLVGPDELYTLPRPVDAPLEVIPTKLTTAISQCLAWWSFEEFDFTYGDVFNPVWGAYQLEAYWIPGDFVTTGPFDGSLVASFTDTGSPIVNILGVPDVVEDFIPVANDPFSINVWFKFADGIAHDQILYHFGRPETDDGTLINCAIQLKVVPVIGFTVGYKLVARSSDGVTLTTVETNEGDVVPGIWHMATVRFDQSSLKLSVCAVGETKVSYSGAATGVVRPIYLGNPAACIGRDEGANTWSLVGQLAHMGLWNVALRDHEVDALFNNGLGLDKPVYYI